MHCGPYNKKSENMNRKRKLYISYAWYNIFKIVNFKYMQITKSITQLFPCSTSLDQVVLVLHGSSPDNPMSEKCLIGGV